jgi:hypothetical protein
VALQAELALLAAFEAASERRTPRPGGASVRRFNASFESAA